MLSEPEIRQSVDSLLQLVGTGLCARLADSQRPDLLWDMADGPPYRLRTIDVRSSLRAQFQEQFKLQRKFYQPDLTLRSLAAKTGFSRDAIALALAKDPPPGRESISLPLAHALGRVLGFSAVYVALCHSRDEVQRRLTASKNTPELLEQLKDIHQSLSDELGWLQPYLPGERVGPAMRASRVRAGLDIGEVARRAAGSLGLDERLTADKLALLLDSYEWGRVRLPRTVLLALLRAIGPELSPKSLRERIQRMHEVHVISDTLVEPAGRFAEHFVTGKRAAHDQQEHFLCPAQPGYSLRFRTSPMISNALDVHAIDAWLPEPGERSRVRILNALHEGYEFGVLVKGSVLMTIKKRPFPPEQVEDTPVFVEGQDDVVCHRVFKAGDAVAFRSGLYHRIEFLERENSAISLNIMRSVLLHRLTRQRKHLRRSRAQTDRDAAPADW